MRKWIVLLLLGITALSCKKDQAAQSVDVLVLGSGTGGVAAAIQSARSGAKTVYVNPLAWHGGMLTAAGVSATDGNHHLPAGIWGEFRNAVYDHYGGREAVATGWVSNTHFEPKVGAAIFEDFLAQTSSLRVYKEAYWKDISYSEDGWSVSIHLPGGDQLLIKARQLIDGTDLGDVAASVGVEFDLGMDSRELTGEWIAPAQGNAIIQDLTYVAILKDYGQRKAPLVEKPPAYHPEQFDCLCDQVCDEPEAMDCELMLNYAKLPNNKYMVNWPIAGNDYYLNVVSLPEEERELAYQAAKLETLRFVYFLQQELGYRHLGLAQDEFPTEDYLALMPYHREGRRIKGLVQFRLQHILQPYQSSRGLYRTGIAVGDYPIDHHHGKNPAAPQLDFPPVPSFTLPAGALIPQGVADFLVADKAISVSNIVNGSTRLQPVILQIGQVAGLMAAMASAKGISPAQLSVREVQEEVLKLGGYLQPYFDLSPKDPHFEILQRVGSTGLLMGVGEPYQWANRTWLYPDSLLLESDLLAGFKQLGLDLEASSKMGRVSPELAIHYLQLAATSFKIDEDWAKDGNDKVLLQWKNQQKETISRRDWALLLDQTLQPFQRFQIDFEGRLIKDEE